MKLSWRVWDFGGVDSFFRGSEARRAPAMATNKKRVAYFYDGGHPAQARAVRDAGESMPRRVTCTCACGRIPVCPGPGFAEPFRRARRPLRIRRKGRGLRVRQTVGRGARASWFAIRQ